MNKRRTGSIHRLLIIMMALALTGPLAAGDTPSDQSLAGKFVETALNDRFGYTLLREVCEIGPRLSGSENSAQAIQWAKEKMEELKFDRVFLQPVMVPHWVRGEVEKAEIVQSAHYAGKSLNISAYGGSVGTPPQGIVAGVVEVHSFEELNSLGEKARGKIIFFNQPFEQGQPETFQGYRQAVVHRVRGASAAAKVGGVAALVRSVTTRFDNVTHVGNMRYDPKIGKVPAAAIGVLDAEFLSDALQHDPELQIKIELSCQTLPDVQSYNVIGDLLGTEYPNEYVVVSGHFDSWDKGDGAHDDASGCMQALEVLTLFQRLGIKPRRTVRCIFYINEENGTRGGLAYAALSDSLGLKHVAAIESDRGAFTPRGFNVETDSASLAHMQSWLPVLRQAGIEWVREGGSGSDIEPLKSSKALIGYVPDGQRYFDFHHSDNDVFEAVHPREFEMGSAAMATLVYLLSEYGL